MRYIVFLTCLCELCHLYSHFITSPSPPQTTILNKYLQEQMEGLTAKVFRTFNASITLQEQLEELTQGKALYTVSLCSVL